MMPVLLQYRRDDGTITGRWEANTWELLAPQVVEDDPTYGYVATDVEHRMHTLADAYYVNAVEEVVEKTALTLTATRTAFPADGQTVCAVSVTPFVACTLLVDGAEMSLTEEDQILELTADEPHVFRVEVLPLTGYRADPLRLEAL